MPVSPELAADLATAVSGRYAEAEQVMLATIAKALAKGIDGPRWAENKLANVRNLQSELRLLLKELDPAAAKLVSEAVQTAWDRGAAVAAKDLATELIGPSAPSRAVARLAREAISNVVGTHPRILRSSMDAYRSVIAKASAQTLIGTQTRRGSAQSALDIFARKGITGFIDKSGRGWRLESYVEMAVRSTTAHAAIAAHTDTLVDHGQDLVMVSDAPQECETCRPWEGKILSLTGDTKGYKTLEDATSAGLYHPNCRHSLGIYLPGVTKPMSGTADPQGNADRVRLRDLERRVRAAKRVQAVALDPTAERVAGGKVRAYQAQIRDHVAGTTAKRQPFRERLGAYPSKATPKPDAYWRETNTSFRGASLKTKPTEAWARRQSDRLLPAETSAADKERIASLLSQHPEKFVKKVQGISLPATDEAMQRLSMAAGMSKSEAGRVAAFWDGYDTKSITMGPGFDDLTFHHEMGHAVQQFAAKAKAHEYESAFQTNDRFDRHTDYAKSSFKESFAESYAAFVGAGSPLKRVSDPHYEGTFAVLRKVIA